MKYRIVPISQVIREHKGHWFSFDTMKFFKTILYDIAYEIKGVRYFITSEKPPFGPRQYSIRRQNVNDGKIETVGEFGEFHLLRQAQRYLMKNVLNDDEGTR